MWSRIRTKAVRENGRGKSGVSHLDALDAGFAVVAFDVDFNFGVADEAERHTKEQTRWRKRLQTGFFMLLC